MESRKLQKIGPTTLMVSLPKEWVLQNGLQAGDAVHVDTSHSGFLKILSSEYLERAKKPQKYSIHYDQAMEENLLHRLIVGSYMIGSDVIEVTSPYINSKLIEVVRAIVQKLVGTNIVETTEKSIVIQCFIDQSKVSIPFLIERMSFTTGTMLMEATQAVLHADSDLATTIENRIAETRNLYWLTTRLILWSQKHLFLSPEQMPRDNQLMSPASAHVVSLNLERIANHCNNLANISLNLQTIFQTSGDPSYIKRELLILTPIAKKLLDVYSDTITALTKNDLFLANTVLNNIQQLYDVLYQQLQEAALAPFYRTICLLFRMIAENCEVIALSTVNIEISKSSSHP